jgi:ankyrin repeat protein
VDIASPNEHENGRNILHLACECGHKEAVAYILSLPQRSQLMNQRDSNNLLPFDIAKQKGHHEIVQFLLDPDDPELTMFLMTRFSI